MPQSAPPTNASTPMAIPRVVRFLAAGGFAALVNLVSRYMLTSTLGFGASVLAAYMIGMVVAYTLFRTLVFEGSGRSVMQESLRFVAVNCVALGLVWLTSVGLAQGLFPIISWTWHADDIAHVIGVSLPAISSYIGHSRYTFGRAA